MLSKLSTVLLIGYAAFVTVLAGWFYAVNHRAESGTVAMLTKVPLATTGDKGLHVPVNSETGNPALIAKANPTPSSLPAGLSFSSEKTIKLQSTYMASYERNRISALFASLKGRLTSEQLDRLAAALGDRKLEINEILQLSRQTKVNPEALVEEARLNALKRINAEFGADVAASVREYERTIDQRAQLNDLNAQLVYDGTPLTGVQIDALSTLLTDQQKVSFGSAIEDTVESVDEFVRKKREENEAVLASASAILSPGQLNALRERMMRFEDYARLRRSQAADRAAVGSK